MQRTRDGERMNMENDVKWESGYLPVPCVCGRQRLIYAMNDENNVVRVRCEKCNRDNTDNAWNFDVPRTV